MLDKDIREDRSASSLAVFLGLFVSLGFVGLILVCLFQGMLVHYVIPTLLVVLGIAFLVKFQFVGFILMIVCFIGAACVFFGVI